jgi:SAM-dependent methyltransferase
LTTINGWPYAHPSTDVDAYWRTDVTETHSETTLREAVRERYAKSALEMADQATTSCCGTDCCGDPASGCAVGYDAAELASVGLSATASLGCGNPTLLADLRAGETVLDLGSGAGLDVLLSAHRVGPTGHAYGVDMTDEMLALARANQQRAGLANATFLKGTIEAVPLPDAAVDVIISNCVINLAADKAAVLREAFRVLRPGGRLAISDMVAITELPPEAKRALDLWAGCVAGTIPVSEYSAALSAAGFVEQDIEITREVALPDVDGTIASAYIRARKEAS